MSISEIVTFDNRGEVERFPLFRKLFLTIIILLVATLSFGIGRLSVSGSREPVRIEYNESLVGQDQSASVINAVSNNKRSGIVASKNGSKYHYSHCPGAKQISEKNLITFSSAESAIASGYTLALNCKP